MSTKTDSNKPKASDHESYITFTIIALILPIVGIILGIVYLTRDDKADKKLGEHLIAISVLFTIIWGTAYSIFASSLFSTPQIYQQ